MVALVSNFGGQFSGGTLVASKYVVTAAHCMFQDQDLTILNTVDNFKVREDQEKKKLKSPNRSGSVSII